MHHLRYDGTYRLSLFMELSQGVDVNYVMPCMLPGHVSQGPFHSYGVRRHLVNRARNDKNKLREKLFSICLATHPRKSGTWNNSPPPGPKGWNCPCSCPRGSNKSNWTVHQWYFSSSFVPLLAVVFGSYWNFWPWRNSHPQELVMGLCHEQTGTYYNDCVIIENCWRK